MSKRIAEMAARVLSTVRANLPEIQVEIAVQQAPTPAAPAAAAPPPRTYSPAELEVFKAKLTGLAAEGKRMARMFADGASIPSRDMGYDVVSQHETDAATGTQASSPSSDHPPIVLTLHAPSGVGKTETVERLLAHVPPEALVFGSVPTPDGRPSALAGLGPDELAAKIFNSEGLSVLAGPAPRYDVAEAGRRLQEVLSSIDPRGNFRPEVTVGAPAGRYQVEDVIAPEQREALESLKTKLE